MDVRDVINSLNNGNIIDTSEMTVEDMAYLSFQLDEMIDDAYITLESLRKNKKEFKRLIKLKEKEQHKKMMEGIKNDN